MWHRAGFHSRATVRVTSGLLSGLLPSSLQGDVMLRGLRFLDTMLQRDMLQKAAFLKDLPSLCALFDPRVLRLKVRVAGR